MNIGRFYNVTELGHGGMGTVYSGYCDGKKVAIKKFRRNFMSGGTNQPFPIRGANVAKIAPLVSRKND